MDPIYEAYHETISEAMRPQDWAVDAVKKKLSSKDLQSFTKPNTHVSNLPQNYGDRVEKIKQLMTHYKYKILKTGWYKDKFKQTIYAVVYMTDPEEGIV